jgi:hypothetical protein
VENDNEYSGYVHPTVYLLPVWLIYVSIQTFKISPKKLLNKNNGIKKWQDVFSNTAKNLNRYCDLNPDHTTIFINVKHF